MFQTQSCCCCCINVVLRSQFKINLMKCLRNPYSSLGLLELLMSYAISWHCMSSHLMKCTAVFSWNSKSFYVIYWAASLIDVLQCTQLRDDFIHHRQSAHRTLFSCSCASVNKKAFITLSCYPQIRCGLLNRTALGILVGLGGCYLVSLFCFYWCFCLFIT